MDGICRHANTLRAILLATLSSTPFVHAQEHELHLGVYVAQVTAANPALIASEQRSEAMQRRVKPAATLDDPFVAFGVDEIPFGDRRWALYRYQFSQSVPFPGKLRAREEAAAQRARVSAYDAETERRELTVVATQQFYRTFYNTQATLLNLQLQELVRASMGSARARYEAGGSEHHDWLLAKIELATLAVEHKKLQQEHLWLRAALNELRGRAPDEELGTLAVGFSDDSSDEVDASLDGQPELDALDAQAAWAQSEYEIAELGYYPDFVVQAMAMQPRDTMDGNESNWGLMIGVNVPLYAWRKQANLVAAARHERHAVEMEKLYLRNRLRTEIVNARQALASAREMVLLYERDVLPATRSAIASARSAYQSRRMELAKYLLISRVHKTQQLELLATRIDVELARTRMKELLSFPPLLQLAPSRPTVFGAGDMDAGMQGPDAVSMGSGMTAPKRADKSTDTPGNDSNSSMGGMQ